MNLLMSLFPFFWHSPKLKLLITHVLSFKGKESYKENIKLSNEKNELSQKKNNEAKKDTSCLLHTEVTVIDAYQ